MSATRPPRAPAYVSPEHQRELDERRREMQRASRRRRAGKAPPAAPVVADDDAREIAPIPVGDGGW